MEEPSIKSVNIITLGCSKNLVDSERLLRQLSRNGFNISHNSPDYSDAVIINTCGFILDAKTESVETILSYVNAKDHGFIKKLFVIGCLSQRYKESLKTEIPEVDLFFGVNQEREVLDALGGKYFENMLHERIITTPSHYAYLKVSEGCNHNCSFCTIPFIRGKQVSKPVNEIIKEVRFLTDRGVKEIILIAQDLSSYGTDIYSEKALIKLLNELAHLDRLEWIRLHYLFPAGLPVGDIISVLKRNPEICRYIDIPIQHISESILRSMNRGHGRKEIEKIIGAFRDEIPDLAIRTTLITGYPGETEKDFAELKEYVQSVRFDRLGVFTYSEEEGTRAAGLKDDVPADTKEARKEEILDIQRNISLRANLDKIGKKYRVLIDGIDGEFYKGRTEHDSPEIDNEVLIPSDSAKLIPGNFYDAVITDGMEFDLFGEVVKRPHGSG